MATRKLPLWKSYLFTSLLALAPLPLTGCRNSGASSSDGNAGRQHGNCSGNSCCAKQPNRTPGNAEIVPPSVVPAIHEKQVSLGGQKTCPVTGDELGTMGSPIPVTLPGGQTLYVCCSGCAIQVLRDPQKYLRIVEAERQGQ